ncbi:hypothetical protein JOB18_013797 [Solea senegalensis]|uniref:Uncharacterized protein n=1 Tax=Solea senegalensis TaxID=28829 RepID=A0AAV6SMW9_SOLSE|nr:hypothetical protein JOB18_013797 [Solea senegalensis]
MQVNCDEVARKKPTVVTLAAKRRSLVPWRSFLRAFNHTINSGTDDDVDRWYFLEQYTRGKPREPVRSCQCKSASHRHEYATQLLMKDREQQGKGF